jgi:hypothetical protein
MHPLFGLDGWSPRSLWYTGLEAILELSWDTLHVAHTSGTSGLSPLGLLAPVVYDIVLAQMPHPPVPLIFQAGIFVGLKERTLSDLSSRVTA